MPSLTAIPVDPVPCLIAVRCALPTIAIKAVSPVIRSGIFVWRSLLRFACGTICMFFSKPLNGRTGIRSAAGIEATNSELKRAHGIGKLRVRRAVKVCFVVACKIIACNIKRWAKAHMALKRLLQGCLSSFRVCVKLWSDLIEVSLFKKQIFSTVGTPSW